MKIVRDAEIVQQASRSTVQQPDRRTIKGATYAIIYSGLVGTAIRLVGATDRLAAGLRPDCSYRYEPAFVR